MKTLTIDSLKTDYTCYGAYRRMTYLLMPLAIDETAAAQWCARAKTNIAIVTGFDWDNDLTPWPAPEVPAGPGIFAGRAPQLLERLQRDVIPAVEGGAAVAERNLVGVSLSGLFALWAWMTSDTFRDVCSISGSFWYEGFVSWLQGYDVPRKEGAALFLLGRQEPHSRQKVFATVGTCTAEVVARLREAGVDAVFKWVDGNHYSPIEPRLDLCFDFLAGR